MGDGFVITSNRDESKARAVPEFQHSVVAGHKTISYPKDVLGGTWFASDSEANCLVLLNGAFDRHERKLPYRKSRGLIVLELISSEDIEANWDALDLENIEPFTLVYLSKEQELFEWVWDGSQKQGKCLDVGQWHIWMSRTLYTQEDYDQNHERFSEYLKIPDFETIEYCHREGEYEHVQFAPKFDIVDTVSRTQLVIADQEVQSFKYKNLRGELLA